MEDRQPRNRRQFTAEFKRDAVELVRTRWPVFSDEL
jgi:transposase-like protein